MSRLCLLGLAILLGVTFGLTPLVAWGAGYQIRENSAQALGRAFAGSASRSGDLAVVANNPAAMSRLQGTGVQVDVSWIDLAVDFDGGGRDAFGRPLTGGDGGDAGGLAAVPAAYWSTPLGERGRLGASLTAPFGLATDYDAEWVGRYQAIHSELRSVALGLALSWELSDALAVGGSLIHQSVDAELSRAIDFGAALAAVPGLPPGAFAPQSADGRTRFRGDDRAFGASLGLVWRLSDATRLGLLWRSRIEHTLEGDVDYAVPANVASLLAAGGITRFAATHGRVELTTPSMATLSLERSAGDRLVLLADVSFTDWSEFDETRLRSANAAPESIDVQDWRDSWFGSLGAEYRATESLTLRTGLAYDQTPTRTAHRTAAIPDIARRWLSLGMSWQASESAVVHVGYTHLFTHEPALANRSATASTLDGDFASRTDLLAVSLGYTF